MNLHPSLPRLAVLLATAGVATLGVIATPARGALTTYEITSGQLSFFSDETWTLESGSIGITLFNVSTRSDGIEEAIYKIESFNLNATDNTGGMHTILSIPDGTPTPIFSILGVPDEVLDIGVLSVFSDGFIDFIVADLSIDGQPVNPSDNIGGPAVVGTSWQGAFPVPSEFTVLNTFADLSSAGLFGEATLSATIPEPSWALLGIISLLSMMRRQR